MNTPRYYRRKPPPVRGSLMCGETAAVNNGRIAWSESPCHRHHRPVSVVRWLAGLFAL